MPIDRSFTYGINCSATIGSECWGDTENDQNEGERFCHFWYHAIRFLRKYMKARIGTSVYRRLPVPKPWWRSWEWRYRQSDRRKHSSERHPRLASWRKCPLSHWRPLHVEHLHHTYWTNPSKASTPEMHRRMHRQLDRWCRRDIVLVSVYVQSITKY